MPRLLPSDLFGLFNTILLQCCNSIHFEYKCSFFSSSSIIFSDNDLYIIRLKFPDLKIIRFIAQCCWFLRCSFVFYGSDSDSSVSCNLDYRFIFIVILWYYFYSSNSFIGIFLDIGQSDHFIRCFYLTFLKRVSVHRNWM